MQKLEQPLLALVGNPNAGKTTLFNSLTGSSQKVGNYAGVTVEKVSGTIRLPSGPAELIDVPGLYSLKAMSEDEVVALQVIQGSLDLPKPELLVCVIDATNLERNLYLYAQLVELEIPIVIALTMTDRLPGKGMVLDIPALSRMTGAEVVPLVGHRDKGIDALRDAIDRNLVEPHNPEIDLEEADDTKDIESLKVRMARLGIDCTGTEIRRALWTTDGDLEPYLSDFPEVRSAFDEVRLRLGPREHGSDVSNRYRWAASVQAEVLRTPDKEPHKSQTDKVDKILTHRVFGLIIFVAVMYLVFQSIYTFAQPLMTFIQDGVGIAKASLARPLAGWPVLQSLLIDGVVSGVGAVLVFLPQILILFFFISLLEGTGYLARAAFLMDRLLGWCGLNGRAFIPLLSSFACAIPGIMAARVMPDRNSRLATILVSPLMSCSARLPVYILLIGAFIEPKYGAFWAGFSLFAMHLLGLFVAIPVVWFLNRKVIRGRRLPFVLELPPYQWPKWRDVWVAMYSRGKVFLHTAGTIIVVMSVLIWALSYFPRLAAPEMAQARATYLSLHPNARAGDVRKAADEQQLANSVLGRFGKSIEPVFRPAGFDWRITTAILSAFPARETVVPSLGIIFSLGGDVDERSGDLRQAMKDATWPDGKPLFTLWTSIGLMIFFALCAQCMATLATVRRETNSWKWPLFMFSYMTVFAYIAAVVVHQFGVWVGG